MWNHVGAWMMLVRVGGVIFWQTALYSFGFRSFSETVERGCQQLVQISVLYVKLFQAIALNQDWVPEEVRTVVLRFTDNPPFDAATEIDYETLDVLRRQYGISVCGWTPINAGMISLVFLASDLRNNQKLVVKLKRRGIDDKLREAIGHVMYFVELFDAWIPALRNMQVANVVRKNIHTIQQQTDFATEVRHTQLFRQNFARVKYVRIPEVRGVITEVLPNVMVLEYLPGCTLAQLPREEYAAYAKLVLKFSFTTSMMHSVAHGDLHAGNLLFMKEPETGAPLLGVIDFGIVYRLSEAYKQMLYDVFSNLLERTPRETARKMLASNYIEPRGIMLQLPAEQYERIVDVTERIIDDCVNRRNGRTQVQMFEFVRQLNEQLKTPELVKLGVRVSDEFVQTQMMLAMSHGVAHTLTGGDLVTAVNDAMEELFHVSWIIGLNEQR